MPVIRDPKHPDFPHGKPVGRSRGCDCTPCRDAKAAQVKRNKLIRMRAGNQRCVSPELGQRVTEHIEMLLREVPEASVDLIGVVSGVGGIAFQHYRSGKRGLSRRAADGYLAVTPTKLRAGAKLVPAEPVRLRIRRLQSLGYPLTWMRRKTGVFMGGIVAGNQERVEIHVLDAVEALEELTEWRHADPERDGITKAAMNNAKHCAARAGVGEYVNPRDDRKQVDKTETVRLIRWMQALGYPLAWQSVRTGSRADQIVYNHAKSRVTLVVQEKYRDLYKQVGERPADPRRDGLKLQSISRTRNMARRDGFYPPACYDDDGNLMPRFVPGHPWARSDEMCHERIERLEFALKNPGLAGSSLATAMIGGPSEAGIREHSTLARNFDRVLEHLGIRDLDGIRGEQRRERLIEAVWAFRRGDGDPVTFCLDHGMVAQNKIAADHPSLLAHPSYQPGRRRRRPSEEWAA